MDNKCCSSCGKEMAGEDGVVCPDCKSDIRHRGRKRLWYFGAAAVILILVGAIFLYGEKNVWDFSWNALIGRPSAVVNGEPIARSEARERLNVSRLMLEKEYGKGLFAGEQGRALLGRLERNVLEKMVEERLVAQEASRLKIRVDDDRVRQEIQKIGREIYGNWENFQTSLKEDGISPEYLMNHVRNLLLRQEVKKVKSPPEADPDTYFVAWLTQDRRSAKVTFNQTITPLQTFAQGQRSCCGSGGGGGAGGCGGGGQQAAAGPLDPQLKSEASTAALDAYRKTNPADKDVAAQVTDYGCHVQVDIEQGGRVVKSYAYQDGRVIDN